MSFFSFDPQGGDLLLFSTEKAGVTPEAMSNFFEDPQGFRCSSKLVLLSNRIAKGTPEAMPIFFPRTSRIPLLLALIL